MPRFVPHGQGGKFLRWAHVMKSAVRLVKLSAEDRNLRIVP
jgi:hypothetical protein